MKNFYWEYNFMIFMIIFYLGSNFVLDQFHKRSTNIHHKSIMVLFKESDEQSKINEMNLEVLKYLIDKSKKD